MEILDIYDKFGGKTGKTIVRGNKNFGDNEYIKLATLWLKSKDKYLLQVCSKEKGGEYAVTGGHVKTGATSLTQAVIEALEELNLDLQEDSLQFLGSIIIKHAIFDIYLHEDDNLSNYKFTLQTSEVESVLWLTKNQIESLPENLLRKSTKLQYDQYIKDKK